MRHNDDFGRVHRGSLPIGAKAYFNGFDQRDGYATKDAALEYYRDYKAPLDGQIDLLLKQFVGIYTARLSLGAPDQHGRRQATGWQWVNPPPSNVNFYERLNDDLDAHSSDSGVMMNTIIMERWFNDDEEILSVACWVHFSTSEYMVELRHIATHLHTEASLDSLKERAQ